MNSLLSAGQRLLLQICKLLWAFSNSPLTFEDELMYAFIILGKTVFDGQNNFFAKKFLKELFHQSKYLIILSTSLFWLSVYTCTILQIQVHHIRLFYANNNITECTIISDFSKSPMALLTRFLKLSDAEDTQIFTFVGTKSVTRDLNRVITSKEFRWTHNMRINVISNR